MARKSSIGGRSKYATRMMRKRAQARRSRERSLRKKQPKGYRNLNSIGRKLKRKCLSSGGHWRNSECQKKKSKKTSRKH